MPAAEFPSLPEKFSPRCEFLVCWITMNRLFSSLEFVSPFPSQVFSTQNSSWVSVCKELCDKLPFYYSVRYFTANCAYTKEIKHEVQLDIINFSVQYNISGTSCKINCNGNQGNKVVPQRMISADIYFVDAFWKMTRFHLSYLNYGVNSTQKTPGHPRLWSVWGMTCKQKSMCSMWKFCNCITEVNNFIGCLVGLEFVSTYMGNFWRNQGSRKWKQWYSSWHWFI